MKEKLTTIGDFIKVLSKFDPELPMFDKYDDENEGECWFNLQKPRPKVKTLFLLMKEENGKMLMKLTDNRGVPAGWKLVSKQKILILYPMNKGEIEVDL